jgi:hypothetical protein
MFKSKLNQKYNINAEINLKNYEQKRHTHIKIRPTQSKNSRDPPAMSTIRFLSGKDSITYTHKRLITICSQIYFYCKG